MKDWRSAGITLVQQIPPDNRPYTRVNLNDWYTYRYPRRDRDIFREPQPELVKVPMTYFRRYEVFSGIDPVDMEKLEIIVGRWRAPNL